MSQEQIDKHFASAKADRDERAAKASQANLESSLQLILRKLDAIDERLANLENAIAHNRD